MLVFLSFFLLLGRSYQLSFFFSLCSLSLNNMEFSVVSSAGCEQRNNKIWKSREETAVVVVVE
jgi:hypothetical protein